MMESPGHCRRAHADAKLDCKRRVSVAHRSRWEHRGAQCDSSGNKVLGCLQAQGRNGQQSDVDRKILGEMVTFTVGSASRCQLIGVLDGNYGPLNWPLSYPSASCHPSVGASKAVKQVTSRSEVTAGL